MRPLTFGLVFDLPKLASSESVQAQSTAERRHLDTATLNASRPSGPLTILVVEDNPADLYLIKVSLQLDAPGCLVIVAEDGDAAIRYLSQNRPDLAILDWNIPLRNGLEVLTFARSEERLAGLPLVVFSSSPKEALEYRAAQADAFIQKPFELERFLEIGRQALQCLAECEGRSAGL